MLRLITFSTLLAVAVAQNGYDYNKPNQPFSQGATPNRPGSSQGLSGGFQGKTPSFSGSPQTGYANSATGSGQGYSAPSNYPSGPSQGYPGTDGPTSQSGYPQGISQGQQAFPGQAPSGFSGPNGFAGQAPIGISSPSGPNYQDQGQGYPGQLGGTGFGSDDTGAYENGDYSAIPGEPDKDYPILTEIPQTSFRCDAQAYPGYYADVEARCQVFHVCANNRTFDFLCPNGTIFSQQVFVCVWWNQFDCNTAPSLYELNANLYDYSKTGSSSQTGYPGASDYNQGQNGPQVPSTGYAAPSGPQGPGNGYPAPTGLEGPSNGYPGRGAPGPTAYQGSPGSPSSSYVAPAPGQSSYSAPQGPTASYSGPQGVGGFPGSGSQGYPGGSQGYPSGKPSGPAFPGGRQQSDAGFPAQLPNREYLPPRN